ncbi:MAG TPA: hypothetical protein VGM27_27170 [Acidobacteriaceae bacterium]|jgi:hypothetical protein
MSVFNRRSFWAFGLIAGFFGGSFCCAGTSAYAQQIALSESASVDPERTTPPEAANIQTFAPEKSTPTGTEAPQLPDDPSVTNRKAEPVNVARANAPSGSPSKPVDNVDSLAEGRQTKRILYIVPNFRAVSADSILPPQSIHEKMRTAAEDSFDYSSIIFVGLQSGLAMMNKSYPEFHQGVAGYSRYYWHTLADTVDENLWVEFLIPSAVRQDTRYYTLNKGSFVKRFTYAFTRIAITRTDEGHQAFNASEILGAGAAASLSNMYYPSAERTEVKTYQRWITSILIDGGTFVFKEFWPNINNTFFHEQD